jgi:hypothetical protein
VEWRGQWVFYSVCYLTLLYIVFYFLKIIVVFRRERLFKRLRPSVGSSIRPSVRLSVRPILLRPRRARTWFEFLLFIFQSVFMSSFEAENRDSFGVLIENTLI